MTKSPYIDAILSPFLTHSSTFNQRHCAHFTLERPLNRCITTSFLSRPAAPNDKVTIYRRRFIGIRSSFSVRNQRSKVSANYPDYALDAPRTTPDPAHIPVAFHLIYNAMEREREGLVRGHRAVVPNPFPTKFGTQSHKDCIYRLRFIGVVTSSKPSVLLFCWSPATFGTQIHEDYIYRLHFIGVAVPPALQAVLALSFRSRSTLERGYMKTIYIGSVLSVLQHHQLYNLPSHSRSAALVPNLFPASLHARIHKDYTGRLRFIGVADSRPLRPSGESKFDSSAPSCWARGLAPASYYPGAPNSLYGLFVYFACASPQWGIMATLRILRNQSLLLRCFFATAGLFYSIHT